MLGPQARLQYGGQEERNACLSVLLIDAVHRACPILVGTKVPEREAVVPLAQSVDDAIFNDFARVSQKERFVRWISGVIQVIHQDRLECHVVRLKVHGMDVDEKSVQPSVQRSHRIEVFGPEAPNHGAWGISVGFVDHYETFFRYVSLLSSGQFDLGSHSEFAIFFFRAASSKDHLSSPLHVLGLNDEAPFEASSVLPSVDVLFSAKLREVYFHELSMLPFPYQVLVFFFFFFFVELMGPHLISHV